MGGQPKRSLDPETRHALLSKRRREYLLNYVGATGGAGVEEAARYVAAWERGTSVDAFDEETHERVTVSLVHNHLPRLDTHDVVEFDRRSGDIEPGDAFDELVSVADSVTCRTEYP